MGSALSFAKVDEETLCFRSTDGRKVRLVLKHYLDADLNQPLGALVRLGSSTPALSLAFDGDATADESLDWQLNWLELTNGRVSGRYALKKPRGATVQSAYVIYRSLKTRKDTTFEPDARSQQGCSMQ